MKRVIIFFIAYVITFPFQAQTFSPDLVFSPIQVLNSEYSYLKNQILRLQKGELRILFDSPIKSSEDGVIHVGLKQLKQITDATDDYYEKVFLVRVVLAHELAHQLQFLDKDKYLKLNNSLSKVNIELQADIIAGHLAFYTLIQNILTHPELEDKVSEQTLYKSFDLLLEKGLDEDVIGTHPSKNDRLLGFKQGAAHGVMCCFYNFYKYQQQIGKGAYAEVEPIEMDLLFEDGFKILDYNYLEKDNLISWSFEQAQMITHGNPIAVRDLALVVNERKIIWHKTRKYPFVEYDLRYKNIGENKIKVDLEIYTQLKKRIEESRDSLKYGGKVNVDFHHFVLQPNQEIEVKGDLNWAILESKSKYNKEAVSNEGVDLPSICYPSISQRDTFFKVNYVDDILSEMRPQEMDNEFFFGHEEKFYKKASRLLTLIKYVSRGKLEEISTGLAQFYRIDDNREQITHRSSKKFSSKTETKINKSTKGGVLDWEEVFIHAKEKNSSTENKKIFIDFVKLCKENLNNNAKPFITKTGAIRYEFDWKNIKILATLSKDKGHYFFVATIEKTN